MLLFVDTETTGLDLSKHEIIDIWVTLCDSNLEIHAEGGGKVKPVDIESANPKALLLNGYNEDEWQNAEPFADVWGRIRHLFRYDIWVGHNPNFDLRFIRRMVYDHTKDCFTMMPLRMLDTRDMCQTLYLSGNVPDRSLDTLCDYYKIDSFDLCGERAHSAKGDVYRTMELFGRVTGRFR